MAPDDYDFVRRKAACQAMAVRLFQGLQICMDVLNCIVFRMVLSGDKVCKSIVLVILHGDQPKVVGPNILVTVLLPFEGNRGDKLRGSSRTSFPSTPTMYHLSDYLQNGSRRPRQP